MLIVVKTSVSHPLVLEGFECDGLMLIELGGLFGTDNDANLHVLFTGHCSHLMGVSNVRACSNTLEPKNVTELPNGPETLYR